MNALLAITDSGARWRFLASLILSALAGAFGTALLGLSGWFLTAAALAGLSGAGLVFNHLYPSAGVRGLAFSRVLSRYAEQLVGHDATLTFSQHLRRSLFGAQARAERGFSPLPSDRLAVLIDDVETVEAGFLRVLIPTAAVAASLLVATGFAAAAAPWLGALTLGAGLTAGALLPFITANKARRQADSLASATDGVRAAVARLTDNALELDVYGSLPLESDRLANLMSDHQNQLDRIERPFRGLAAVNGTIGGCLVLLVLAAVGGDGGSLPLAAGAALSILAAFDALGAMAKVFDAAPRAAASAQRVQSRLEATEAVPQPTKESAARLERALPIEATGLALQPAADHPAIGVLTFQINPGTVTLVKGPSGSGKTTLLETLLRLHPTERQRLSFGGVDSADLRTPAVLEHLAISPQFEAFLPGTVREQLLLADPDASDDECWTALERAGIAEAVRSRPRGLGHSMTDRSVGFSGGEMRRLNLARVLMTQASVLVLDEPFAGLEPALTERLIDGLSSWLQERNGAIIVAEHEDSDTYWSDRPLQTIILGDNLASTGDL